MSWKWFGKDPPPPPVSNVIPFDRARRNRDRLKSSSEVMEPPLSDYLLQANDPTSFDRQEVAYWKNDEHMLLDLITSIRNGKEHPNGMLVAFLDQRDGIEQVGVYLRGLNRMDIIGMLLEIAQDMP